MIDIDGCRTEQRPSQVIDNRNLRGADETLQLEQHATKPKHTIVVCVQRVSFSFFFFQGSHDWHFERRQTERREKIADQEELRQAQGVYPEEEEHGKNVEFSACGGTSEVLPTNWGRCRGSHASRGPRLNTSALCRPGVGGPMLLISATFAAC